MYHPWNDAGERHPDWIIRRTSLNGLLEVMCWRRKVILLERGRTSGERRSDLAHAIAHIDLGHRALDDKAEASAERHAAKLLIDLEPLGDALAWSDSRAEVAELLRVDEATVTCRLEHLHPAERAYLRRKLSELHESIGA